MARLLTCSAHVTHQDSCRRFGSAAGRVDPPPRGGWWWPNYIMLQARASDVPPTLLWDPTGGFLPAVSLWVVCDDLILGLSVLCIAPRWLAAWLQLPRMDVLVVMV